MTRLWTAALSTTLLACDSAVDPSVPVRPSATVSATPSSATVQFGLNDHGSPFPPPLGHDHSGNAYDNLVPRTVVIARGGSVTYQVDPVHQPAVYRPGIEPADIRVDATTLEDADLGFGIIVPQFRINDPNGRLAFGPPQALVAQTWTTPPGTFDEPGRYLVICASAPHFVLNNMYGWVIVK